MFVLPNENAPYTLVSRFAVCCALLRSIWSSLENTVDPWIERLWPVLEQECERKSDTGAVNGTAAAIVNQANGNGHNLAAAAPAAATNGNAAATDTVNQALAQLTVSPSTFASHPKLPVDYALLEGVAELTGVAKLPAETCVLTTTGRKVPVPWDGQENARYFTGETKEKAKANGTTVVASPVESDGGTAAVTSSPYTAERPFMARIHGVRCLTTGAAVKRTLHVELDTYGMEWSYTPGDAFGIWAPNDHKLVMSVLERLGVHGDEEVVVTAKSGGMREFVCNGAWLYSLFSSFMLLALHPYFQDPPSHLKSPTTVYDIFRYQVSITSAAIPRKAFYRLLAEYATDLAEKKALLYLSSKQGSDELKRLLSFSPSLFDWLVTFSSVRPDVQRLLDVLLPLVPRHYSITSTPLEHPHHVHCAFNVVEYDRPAPLSDRGHGVCTPWIDTLSGHVPAALNVREPMPLVAPDREVYLPIFPYPSKDFLVPDDDGVPWILIGPGTGIAPFLGFCKHRQLRASPERASSVGTTAGGKKAPVWVFFGCRNADADFLHRDAWEKMLASGTVTKLVTAFSRDEGATPTSKYVQHRLVEHGAAVYGMMVEQQGRIFVCGYD